MKQFFSKLGQSFMLPIALLPAAGIMLGVGGSFTSEAMIKSYNLTSVLGEGTILNNILIVIREAGGIVFANLPLMFAIAVAVGFAKTEKGAAALAAVMAYLVMNITLATSLTVFKLVGEVTNDKGVAEPILQIFGQNYAGMLTDTLGITSTLNMGVFGGMIAGALAVVLHNRYCNVQLPDFLGFFGGARFVPIIASFSALFLGMALVVVWPPIGIALASIGKGLGTLQENGLGFIASLIFGLIERSLIPFGLHHVFYIPLWQTSIGGVYEIAGTNVEGTQAAFFAALEAGEWSGFPSTNFMTGKFPFMMFGLPAAAYAMYKCADPANRKAAGGLLFSVGFTAFLTGITEPIEFTFLFLAPVLYYGIHVPIAGLSFMLMDLLNVRVGMTFSGGFIDFAMFGALPYFSGFDNNFFMIVVVGLCMMPIYYFGFKWYIEKFNIATPGRNGAEIKTISKKDYNDAKNGESSDEFINQIIEGLGGVNNIEHADACITRLRISVKDGSLVRDNTYWTQEMGASGIVINGNAIQVIYGAKANTYKAEINKIIGA